ncbi:MAG TPA: VLRF1 family aeRF1-type release factor [Solirubrobacterales bacterium]|nr:VLRF1 family aeRF1-type release factor [Solirubrobacterales bacterium]
MRDPLTEARDLAGWEPSLGVVSVYLGFDPGDRGGAWRTDLRNGLDQLLERAKEADHERRVALRATAQRLLSRFEDGELRPPPHGEAGFVEVAESKGEERWWPTSLAPAAGDCVQLGGRAAVAPLVDLRCRERECGVVLLSSERVRLLRLGGGELSELEEWELSITSLDWRERKASSGPNPTHGVSSSGHDQFHERLEHNRRRFLAECAGLVGARLHEHDLDHALAFGLAHEQEEFASGFHAPGIVLEQGARADLISTPTGQLADHVLGAAEEAARSRDRALVERVLEAARGGGRGAAGRQDVGEALAEGRVEQLVLDAAIGAPAEDLVRGALGGHAKVALVRGETAEPLASAEGAAALLRY